STHYKLYAHYNDKGVDIVELFNKNLEKEERKPLSAFIKTLEDLKKISDFRLLNETSLQGVLTGFGINVNYISTIYKLYAHYKDKGVDIVDLFNKNLEKEEKKPLSAFIKTLDGLKKISDFKLLNETNLESVLTGFGVSVHYISTHYKLYAHYKDKGVGIVELFNKNLEKEERKPLSAFIKTLEDLKKISDFRLLNETSLQGVLTGFGINVRYISTHYKLYAHYKDKGVDIVDLFNINLERGEGGPLVAFIQTMDELKKISDSGLLKEANLEGVLRGFGIYVRYISTEYKIYTFWKGQGFDIAREFDRVYEERIKGGKVRPSTIVYELRDRLLERGLGLPEGKFSMDLAFYIRTILVSLGKIDITKRIRVLFEKEEDLVTMPSSRILEFYMDMHNVFPQDSLEMKVIELLVNDFTLEEVRKKLNIKEDEFEDILSNLRKKLYLYLKTGYYADLGEDNITEKATPPISKKLTSTVRPTDL
ncbi:MAG: hypothetical protein KKC23_10105, partial [Proteobacteria bacterium]|nr:hypothetical protein [Pseudomonadota bacterium]